MSLCVPSLDVEDNHVNRLNSRRLKVAIHAPSNSSSFIPGVPRLDYEVAELTWKNGQIAMHGLGPPHVVNKYTWDKPRTAETLEAIVIQATLQPHHKHQSDLYPKDLVPWLDHHNSTIASGKVSSSAIVTKDALVPSSISKPYTLMSEANNGPTHGYMLLGSCSGDQSGFGDHVVAGGGEMAAHDLSTCRDQSVTCSETFGMENSQQLTVETFEKEVCVNGFTSTSIDTLEHTVSGQRSTKSTSPDEHDSVFHSRPHKNRKEENKKKGKGKSSILIKRSREAAIHNQSERKRRDKINQKMKSLQKLVPNANKTDKASMLDEVIEYLKQLQAQINMMSRMNMSPMMMPLAMQQQQQFQMAMMNPVGMGMGMGMGMNMGMGMGMNMGMGMSPIMDLNVIGGNRPKIPGMPTVFHPSNFIQPTMTSWDMHSTNNQVPNHNDPMPDQVTKGCLGSHI